MELLADNKTFVATTDSNVKLGIDIETLAVTGNLEEQDGICKNGVSHSRRTSNGTVISICQSMSKEGIEIIVYKMEAPEIMKKEIIARIKSKRFTLLHAFAMSKDYAIVFETPFHI